MQKNRFKKLHLVFVVLLLLVTGTLSVQTDGLEPSMVTNTSPEDLENGHLDAANLIDINGTLFFTVSIAYGQQELWKSDGTSEGTILVSKINYGNGPWRIDNLTNVNGTLFFTVNDGIYDNELWTSDGTSEGTIMVKEIPGEEYSDPRNLIDVNGTLFFTVGYTEQHQKDIWKSDGTSEGTVLVKDFYYAEIGALFNVNGTIYFSYLTDLWKSDGTREGTMFVRDFGPFLVNFPHGFTNLNGTFFFAAQDVHGPTGIWKSDGTPEGTVLVKDTDGTKGGNIFPLTINNEFFFTAPASSGDPVAAIWKSDGTTAGTIQVKEGGFGSVLEPTAVNEILYFIDIDADKSLVTLWKSDGTEIGTVPVKRLAPYYIGGGNGYPYHWMTNIDGVLFFTDGLHQVDHGNELWKSDGTDAGTVMVKDINNGISSSSPNYLTEVNGTLFFVANDGVHGVELWKWPGEDPALGESKIYLPIIIK